MRIKVDKAQAEAFKDGMTANEFREKFNSSQQKQITAPPVQTDKKKQKRAQDLDRFIKICEINHYPNPVFEHHFHSERKWRFDIAFIEWQIAIELEGVYVEGGHAKGRHTSIVGMANDLEKYNTATAMGWRIFRIFPDQLCTTETVNYLENIKNNLQCI